MRKLVQITLMLAILLGLCSCTPALPNLPKIDRHPSAWKWDRPVPSSLPTYDPNSNDLWQMDLRSYDLSHLDLTQSLNDLMEANFDTHTQWPASDKMPSGFNWQEIMEMGKNPGLNVQSLHAKGIDGRGVGIAIIDQPMLVDHQEYADRLQLYEEINIPPDEQSEMHGPAVASIAVGKTIGVAPKSELYYIACYASDIGGSTNFNDIAQGIERILALNRGLPEGRKIRVISISVGWLPENKGYEEVTAAVKNAKNAGILVVSSSLEQTYGFKLLGLGRAPLANPDRVESYGPGAFWASRFYEDNGFANALMVPMDSRTTAGPGGKDDYVFYRKGGQSWAIPYLAGVYALAVQVTPEITPEEFWDAAVKTGRNIELSHDTKSIPFGPILDPVALLADLQGKGK